MQDLVAKLKEQAISNVTEKVTDIESLIRRLRRWWCYYYKRPYKDPLLDTYRWEELLVEFFEIKELEKGPPGGSASGAESDAEYEAWLKKEMGDAYQSADDMVARYSPKEVKDG